MQPNRKEIYRIHQRAFMHAARRRLIFEAEHHEHGFDDCSIYSLVHGEHTHSSDVEILRASWLSFLREKIAHEKFISGGLLKLLNESDDIPKQAQALFRPTSRLMGHHNYIVEYDIRVLKNFSVKMLKNFFNLYDDDTYTFNSGPGVGYFRSGNILIVGESPAKQKGVYDYPFCADVGSSAWLNSQLDLIDFPETKLYWINAIKSNGEKTDYNLLNELQPRKVIALGKIAEKWCTDGAIREHDHVPHPSYWKRFESKNRYPLLDVLEDHK